MTNTSARARMQIPLMKPTFDEAEEEAVVRVLRSGWVTQGPEVARFEQVVADYVGAQHAIALTSCTTALSAALMVMGVGPGDEVLCPSFSYIATANSIVHVGATPVFVDISRNDWAMDPVLAEAKITPRTKAIMPVHGTGLSCDLDPIYEVAGRHNLLVVEDAAPVIGGTYKGRRIGSSDGPVCFSFHPRKIVTSGEGGVITTNDSEFADKLRLLRHHYMSVSDVQRHQSSGVVFEEYEEVGYNFRMTDLQAAVGIAQMHKLDDIIAERRRTAHVYDELISEVPHLSLSPRPADRLHTFQSYAAVVLPSSPISRNDLMAYLLERGITSRRGVMSSHLEPAYVKRFGSQSLPISEEISSTAIILPMYSGMTNAEQQYVVDSMADALGKA